MRPLFGARGCDSGRADDGDGGSHLEVCLRLQVYSTLFPRGLRTRFAHAVAWKRELFPTPTAYEQTQNRLILRGRMNLHDRNSCERPGYHSTRTLPFQLPMSNTNAYFGCHDDDYYEHDRPRLRRRLRLRLQRRRRRRLLLLRRRLRGLRYYDQGDNCYCHYVTISTVTTTTAAASTSTATTMRVVRRRLLVMML